MFESWFTLIKISFGIAFLWMLIELLFRPFIRRHANNQMNHSLHNCYDILVAINSNGDKANNQEDTNAVIFALDQYKDSISKNPRLSKQMGHAEMYLAIRKVVHEESWTTLSDLLEDIRKLEGTIADRLNRP